MQNDTHKANFRRMADKIVYFISSAEWRILTQERVKTRSRDLICFVRDTNDSFFLLYTDS